MRVLRRLAIPALLFLAPLFFFHRVCLGGEAFLLRDLFNWFYPWRTFAADSFARGDFPLWNPYSYMGAPFLANMQSGLLYPPNVVFWIFDFPTAMRLFLIIQFGLAAWFMYLLLRALSCRISSSLTGAFGYAYGGWMVVHVEFPNKLAAAAWLPLIVLGLVRWRRGRRLGGLFLGGLATACCITAGYPVTTFTILLGAGVLWAAWLAAAILRPGGAGSAALAGISLPAIAALGVLASSAQVVPFLEAISLSAYRQEFEPSQILSLSLHPVHFMDLALPRIFGLPGYGRYWGGALHEYWVGHFHVGLVTLGLAVIAMGSLLRRSVAPESAQRRGSILAGVALLLVAVAFCLGDRTPLAPLCIAYLPGFAHFKWLSTASILIAFSLSWLGAFGQDALLESLEARKNRLPPLVSIVVAVGAAAAAACAIIALFFPETFRSFVEAISSPVILPEQRALIAGNLAPARADAIRAGLLAALLGLAWWAAAAGRLRVALLGLFLPFILFFDLKLAAAGIDFSAPPEPYREVPPVAAELKARPDPFFRIYVPRETLLKDRVMYGSERVDHFRWAAGTLLYNLNLPHRLFSASDGDPMRSARWKLYDDWMGGPDDDVRGRLMALGNIAVVLQAGAAGTTEKIEIPVWVPRVHVASGARRLPADEVLRAILRPDWNPYLETIVEDDFAGDPRPGSGHPIEHRIDRIEYTNNDVTIDLENPEPGYLVLADANYPGWRAFLDARPAAIFTANFLFRGIDLPAGRHTVRFEYRPASVLWGGAGSALGVILLGACAILDGRATRRSGPSRPAAAGRGTAPAPRRRSPSP